MLARSHTIIAKCKKRVDRVTCQYWWCDTVAHEVFGTHGSKILIFVISVHIQVVYAVLSERITNDESINLSTKSSGIYMRHFSIKTIVNILKLCP